MNRNPNGAPGTFAGKLADLLVWGALRGWQLLGRPVNILLTEAGLGYTPPARQGLPVVIYVNPRVLEKERGPQLLQGLILHELGHHYAHFSDERYRSVADRCRRDRLANLLNIIEDEHLERRLRALDPEWGECLDALTSYAFKGCPLVLFVEHYLELMQLESVGQARDALSRGAVPGRVISWEYGYELTDGPAGWVSGRQLLDLIAQELAAVAPGRKLPAMVAEALGRLRRTAGTGWCRKGPPGLLPSILEDEVFASGEAAQVVTAKIHISALLEPTDEEKKDQKEYLLRVGQTIAPLVVEFPKLQRFADELAASLNSRWFWSKQRAMLYMMRRNRDFKDAFLPAADMGSRKFRSLIGKTCFQPGAVLRQLLQRWQPRGCTSREHPLQVEVPWLEVLRSGQAPDYYRFLVSLRLGLGKAAAAGRGPVLAALEGVPRNLRKLDMPGLERVTRKVAACLGDGCLDAPGQQERETGETSNLGKVINDALKGQLDDLARPLDEDEAKKRRRELREAIDEAAARIDDWMRRGIDPAEVDRKQQKAKRRGAASSGWVPVSDPSRERPRGEAHAGLEHDLLNIAEQLDFAFMDWIGIPPADPQQYRKLVAPVRGPIRAMRRFLITLGQGEQEVFAARQGRRLDPARVRRLAVMNDPAVAVGRQPTPSPDLFLGICIDCSGSMVMEDRMDKALTFAALVMEAARGQEGVECRTLGFEEEVLWDAGTPGSTRLAGLVPGGGNNDAGALLSLARHALFSRKKHRLLVMISDGFPSGCTLESLAGLVKILDSRYGIKSVQVAVEQMEPERVAFPDFTDLSEHDIPVAVRLFGRMVQRILMRQLG